VTALHWWLADHVLTPVATTCLWLIRQRQRHPVAYWSVLVAYTAAVVAWLVS
jgi:hypothetical protein